MTPNQSESSHKALLDQARHLFSNALVDRLSSTGMGVLEANGQGAFIHDDSNNRYLDAYTSGGSCNLGRHPAPLAEALQRAAQETDQGNFVLISKEKVLLAERLAQFMPDHLCCSYFTVVRGEGMDAACKLARGKTGRTALVGFSGACHGDSGFALSLSTHPDKTHFEPLVPGIDTIALNDMDAVRKKVTPDTAALIIEAVQVENGCAAADPEFLSKAIAHCRNVGALVIIDETQTGFGRTGKRFCIEHSGVSPDILIFGEAVCGGMFNLCGLSFTHEVKTFFDAHPLIHLCTYGGHDIGCRVAVAGLDLYDELRPWETAARLEAPLCSILTRLANQYPHVITECFTMGLLGALTFNTPKNAARFCYLTAKNKVITKQGQVDPASVLIRPALTIGQAELDLLETAMEKAAETL